jgi:hypothetical protein
MKTISSLVLLLAAASLCPAEEENPFLKQTTKKAPPAEAGESFLSLEEHILAPANLVDAWRAAHPDEKDAGEFRAAVQGWITDGKATLDFSTLCAGTVGREFQNESILEQIYPFHLKPAGQDGEWKLPHSFETRHLGYEITGEAIREKDRAVVRAVHTMTKMLPQQPWDQLAEVTREPDDIFIPRFRNFRVPGELNDKEADTARQPGEVSYPAGITHLALRADEDLPQPVVKEAKEDPSGNEMEPDRPVRLIFFRNDPVTDAPASDDPLPENYLLSMRLIQVNQRQLSDWLQKRDLGSAARELNEALEGWSQDGGVEVVRTLSGAGRTGTTTLTEDAREIVYPTEYEPGRRTASEDGKDSRLEFATATSFETRNVGGFLTSRIESDPGGPLLKLEMERVIHSGFTVHHRVLRDGEWLADMTMPRFSTNRWGTTLRLKRGEWMLVGSGAAFKEKGEIDHAHTVLAFVKVE